MTGERISELRELARSSRHKFWANFGEALDETLDALEASQAELEAKERACAQWTDTAHRLREALLRFGRHKSGCDWYRADTCSCGLVAVLHSPLVDLDRAFREMLERDADERHFGQGKTAGEPKSGEGK